LSLSGFSRETLVVYSRPLCPAIGWRHASAREIVGHWRKAGRRDAGPDDDPDTPPAVATQWLSLSGTLA